MNNSVFEQRIKYSFKDKDLLERALTHSSLGKESPSGLKINNERLEFIGDAYLDAIIGTILYEKMDNKGEGYLSKTRAIIVCEKSLARVGRCLNVGEHLDMGKGEELSGGRERESILADCVEAIVGAIFLDGGLDEAVRFVKREFEDITNEAIAGKLFSDYKTEVQEILQRLGTNVKISYVPDREEGPDHKKVFFVHLECNGHILGSGSGSSKKEAEQNAAKSALERGIEDVF